VATLPVEYLRETTPIEEVVEGRKVISHEVPVHRYFSRVEVAYLSLALDVPEQQLERRIDELRYGRRVLEKLWAWSFGKPPFSISRILLPDLLENEVDADGEAHGDVKVYKFHIAGIKDFISVAVFDYRSFKEILFYRTVEPRALIRYLAH